MEHLGNLDSMMICTLEREQAEKHEVALQGLVSRIPSISDQDLKILAESKDGRNYYGKWDHSVIVWSGNNCETLFEPVAVIFAYERAADETHYPNNSIFLHQVAVKEGLQGKGIGTVMLEMFLEYNARIGFRYLTDELVFSLQTEDSDRNKPIRRWYEKKGFVAIDRLKYATTANLVMMLNPDSIRKSKNI